jgi:hypothetical protein
MKDRLDEAAAAARRVDPRAKLCRIFGLALRADGTILLGEPGKYVPRWEYAFADDQDGEAPPRYVTVLYLSPAAPIVDPNAGNVSAAAPFPSWAASSLADSDVLAAAFSAQPGHERMGGFDHDSILYQVEKGEPVVLMGNWKGQHLRMDPVTRSVIL